MGASTSTLIEHDSKVPLLICGHAADECYEDDTLQVFDVPKDCVYVTFTTCSISNNANIIYKKIFSDINNIKYLNDPITYQNELETLFGQEIHIHHPDAEDPISRTYVNSVYGLVGNGNSGENRCWIQLSGINPINENTYKILKPLLSKSKTLTIDHTCDDDVSRIRGFMQLTNFYKASVYPTADELTNHIRKLRETKRIVTTKDVFDTLPVVTQKELFDIKPGIYYNPLCRVIGCHSKNTKTRINQSTRALFKKKNIMNDKDKFAKLLIKAIYNCTEYKNCFLYNHLLKEYAPNKNNYDNDYKMYAEKEIDVLLSQFSFGDSKKEKFQTLIDNFFDTSNTNTNTITNNAYSVTNNNNNFKQIYKHKKTNFNISPTRVNKGGRRSRSRKTRTRKRRRSRNV